MRCRNVVLAVMAIAGCVIFYGCKAQLPLSETLFWSYEQTQIGQTNSAQELDYIQMSAMTLLSKSDTVIASWGQDDNGYQQWLTVTVFGEESGTAARKYFFYTDEKARDYPFVHPKWTGRFDGQLTIDKAMLEKPFADQNARSIAILKWIKTQFTDDAAKVSGDNKNIGLCQMVVNESFEQVLLKLSESPEWASKLSTPEGVKFEHRSYYNGTLFLYEANGLITIAIELGCQPVPKGKTPNPYEPNAPQK
jgi:hypothetical protein